MPRMQDNMIYPKKSLEQKETCYFAVFINRIKTSMMRYTDG